MDYSANKRYPVPDVNRDVQRRIHTVQGRIPGAFTSLRASIEGFAVDNAVFEADQLEDDAWEYARLLGRGGYGSVGLWIKKDRQNQVIDELAIKEQKVRRGDLRTNYRHRVPAMEEATIQTMLQRRSNSIVQLRGVTKLVWPTVYGGRRRMRYYMEYCGGGNLWTMLRKHVAGRTVVPEAFIWQLFAQLADVMEAMQTPPFDHPDSRSVGGNPFVLHLDVKPENILLTRWDTDPHGNIIGYPRARVGDWGVAALTSELDGYNSIDFSERGTPGFLPPEQYNENQFGQTWRQPPPWRDPTDPQDKTYPYTTAHTTFSFAATIYKLMTLDWQNTALEDLLNEASLNTNEPSVHRQNFQIILPEHTNHALPPPIIPTNYSEELKSLVADCLHLDPAQRPPVEYIRAITTAQVANWAQRPDGFKLIGTGEELSADRMHRVLDACQRRARGLPLVSMLGAGTGAPAQTQVPLSRALYVHGTQGWRAPRPVVNDRAVHVPWAGNGAQGSSARRWGDGTRNPLRGGIRCRFRPY